MAPARDRRTGFSRRRQYGVFLAYVLAVAGAVVGAVLLVLSGFDPPAFAAMRMAVASVTAPVSATMAYAVDVVASVPDAVGEHFRVVHQNADLRRALNDSRALNVRAQAIVYDNRRLRMLLRVRDGTGGTVASARLVSSTASSGRRFALLNAGRFQGVRAGMPVIGPDGLIGRVVETGPTVARVLLLSDAESIVPVRRTRDGLPAIAAGRGDGTVDIRAVNAANGRFAVGDVFVSSGVGGIYTPGIRVARVVRAGADTAQAATFATPDTLDFAVVSAPFMPPAPPAPGEAP